MRAAEEGGLEFEVSSMEFGVEVWKKMILIQYSRRYYIMWLYGCMVCIHGIIGMVWYVMLCI